MKRTDHVKALQSHLAVAIQTLSRVLAEADKHPGVLGGVREEVSFVMDAAFETFGYATLLGWTAKPTKLRG
jgi:hypothetical protein